MNKLFNPQALIAFIVLLAFVISCKKDDSSKPAPESEVKDILIGSTLVNPDGQSGTTFVQLIKDLSAATYDNKTALPFSFSTYPICYKNWIFDASLMGEKQTLDRLERLENKRLKKTGSLQLDGGEWACQMAFASDTKAYVSIWNKAKIIIINPTSMTKLGEIDIKEYGYSDQDPNATGMVLRDGLLYVALGQVGPKLMPYPERPQADLLIIDTKTEKPVKMISETTRGLSYPARPVDPRAIFVDEKGDIYVACMGYFGFLPTHKAGILRIKKGETEFDNSYALIIPETAIDGLIFKGDYMCFVVYAGNGKVYSSLQCNSLHADPTKPNFLLEHTTISVEIDLASKTIKALKDIPYGNNYGGAGIYNGKIAFGVSSDKGKGFHIYDPTTGKGTPEPVIKTTGEPLTFIHFGERW